MKRLELLIPPPLVMLLVGLMMWGLSGMFPALAFTWAYHFIAAVAIAFLGLAASLAGVLTFARARTTMDPKHPEATAMLVRSGIYRYSRNPMYLGVLLVLLAWGVYLGNLLSLLCTLVFIAYITRFQIIPEERLLRAKFGQAFDEYTRQVRRWL